jgi:hypothetical protein
MLHRNIPVQPWSPPMNPQPQPGCGQVGGATRHPWDALADHAAETTRLLTQTLAAADPTEAATAALAWQANAAIARQVAIAYAWASLVRDHGRKLADAGEAGLPEGAFRRAFVASGALQAELGEALAESILRFGREFGHLAFAFPASARSRI